MPVPAKRQQTQNKHYKKNACSHKLVCVTHKTVYRNNRALQAASREPGARIVTVILKQFTEQSSFTKSQQGVHCMDCECQSERNLQNNQALQGANWVPFTKKLQNSQALQAANWVSFMNNFQTQSRFATSQLNVIHKQFSETIKLCKLPPKSSEYGSGLLFANNLQNNQTLQEASREFSAWRKNFPAHSSFVISQQRVQCKKLSVVAHKEFTEQFKWCKQPAWRKAKGFCVETLLQQQCDDFFFFVRVYLLQSKSTEWG